MHFPHFRHFLHFQHSSLVIPGLTGDLKRKTRLHHQHLISGRGTTGTVNFYCNLWTRVTLIPKVANLLACED